MAQTVVTKKAPRDRKPKATSPQANPLAIDLGEEDHGPQEIPVRFLRDDTKWYNAHLPKGTLALALGREMQEVDQEDLDAMRTMLDRFIRLMFNGDDAEAIGARLDDPDDRLDLVHVRVLINRIAERATSLPTT